MRRTLRLLPIVVVVWSGCDPKTTPMDAGNVENVCCNDGLANTLRKGTCGTGELQVPIERCTTQPDAGVRADAAVTDASVTAVCGNDMLEPGEGCERNSSCQQGAVCRKCFCEDANTAVQFRDPPSDLVAAGVNDAAADLRLIALTINGPPKDLFSFMAAAQPMLSSSETRYCAVFEENNAEVSRLCVVVPMGAPLQPGLVVQNAGAQERSILQEDSTVTPVGNGFEAMVAKRVNLPIRPGVRFYVIAIYGGTIADRYPEGTATIALSDIIGR